MIEIAKMDVWSSWSTLNNPPSCQFLTAFPGLRYYNNSAQAKLWLHWIVPFHELVRASPFAATSILDRYSIGLEWFDWSKLHSLTMKFGIRGAQVFLSKIREYLDPVTRAHLAVGIASKVGQTAKARSGYRVQSLH
jgi:hypothetical protein